MKQNTSKIMPHNLIQSLKVLLLLFYILTIIPYFPKPAYSSENGITLISAKPKILTLKQDGLNDKITFIFTPEPMSKLCLKIFSLDGMTQIKEIEYNFDGSGSIWWDGKNNNNNYVQPGIYLYQIEADKKIITGSVVVAK